MANLLALSLAVVARAAVVHSDNAPGENVLNVGIDSDKPQGLTVNVNINSNAKPPPPKPEPTPPPQVINSLSRLHCFN